MVLSENLKKFIEKTVQEEVDSMDVWLPVIDGMNKEGLEPIIKWDACIGTFRGRVISKVRNHLERELEEDDTKFILKTIQSRDADISAMFKKIIL